MKSFIQKLLIIILLFFSITFISCKNKNNENNNTNNNDNNQTTNYTLEITGKNELEVGNQTQLSYNANFEVTNPLWSSNNPDVLIVDENGIIKGLKSGSSVITLTTDKISATFIVNVKETIYNLILSGDNKLLEGETSQLSYSITPNEEIKDISFTSSNTEILTIDNTGLMTAIKEGKVTITATYKNAISYFEVTVEKENIDPIPLTINGIKEIRLEQSYLFTSNYEVNWEISNTKYATIDENGLFTPLKTGKVILKAISKDDSSIYEEIEITILDILPTSIKITGSNKVAIGKEITLFASTYPTYADRNFIWESSNEEIAVVDNGKVTGLKEGNVIIKVSHQADPNINNEFNLEVYENPVSEIKLTGKTNLTSGETTFIEHEVIGKEGVSQKVSWSTSNKTIAIIDEGYLLALKSGNVTITATSLVDSSITKQLNITVNKYIAPTNSQEDLDYVHNIMKDMTVNEKIGQLFIGSTSGTSLTSSTITAIEEYKLGNFIFMGNNTPTGIGAAGLATSLQNKFVSTLKIPGFISIDQETGRVCRLTNGGTRFLGNMASAATNNPYNRYLIGQAVGEELKTYGINFNLAPVLDVNNNPANPVINNRSFGDNPIQVALYGNQMLKGLMASNAMACAKHFPGHGNTSVDSHYGLPQIDSDKDNLYSIELAPFISAIYNGIDAIMTTHIVFSAIDKDYPATLSKLVLTNLLREELGFTGLIVTDGMQMQGITKYFGDAEAAVLAIQAGADILCYTSLSGAQTGINAVRNAYQEGKITIEEINEKVERILLKKLKYNLFNDYLPKDNYSTYDTTPHQQLNLELAKQAVTVYKGNFKGLDKTKKTIIYSSKCSYQINDYSGNNNSFGYLASTYLKSKGMATCDFVSISSLQQSEVETRINEAKGYEQIVIAISDANSQQVNFVNRLNKIRPDIIVIALNLPYDINNYDVLNNYLCTFEYTPIMAEALKLLMNGEYIPQGKCPVKLNK